MIDKKTSKIIDKLIHDYYPNAVVLKAVDWDNDLYIVSAPDNGNREELDPFYSVNKHTGEVKPFYMGLNIFRFNSL